MYLLEHDLTTHDNEKSCLMKDKNNPFMPDHPIGKKPPFRRVVLLDKPNNDQFVQAVMNGDIFAAPTECDIVQVCTITPQGVNFGTMDPLIQTGWARS